ncbi:DUF4190 domain-containing protein [Georgenia sp. 10Sc9-8]|uniref:DUF4190 domain-containing protein n=1 Tax=Georgenia halotolerans TaxID=3028317 RepID=A0ABT5U021_9MICO|nr:DUF4190 domain-containing protein [Georgenia halotolerans]
MSHESRESTSAQGRGTPERPTSRDGAGFSPPHTPASSGAAERPSGPARSDPGAPPPFPGTEDVDQRRVLGGAGYTSARPSNDPVAVAAMVLGVAGLVPLVGIAAIVCGHVALRRLRTSRRAGAGLAVGGLVLGYTLTALWVLFYLATRALPG